ncbi:MAG: hypothetical protein R3D57_05570 [Hyphomicrobiaceae bacterium]
MALALVRYEFPGKEWVNALIVGPVLRPRPCSASGSCSPTARPA